MLAHMTGICGCMQRPTGGGVGAVSTRVCECHRAHELLHVGLHGRVRLLRVVGCGQRQQSDVNNPRLSTAQCTKQRSTSGPQRVQGER